MGEFSDRDLAFSEPTRTLSTLVTPRERSKLMRNLIIYGFSVVFVSFMM